MQKSILLRPALASDQKAIRALVRQARVNPLGIKWPNFMVAEIDGQIIGIGQLKVHRDGSRELASIAVQKAYRRQGIASMIIRELLDGEEGTLYLMCLEKMEGFYQGFGFRRATGAALTRDLARIDRLNRYFAKVVSFFTSRPIFGIMMRRNP